jgi:hypothetical protein
MTLSFREAVDVSKFRCVCRTVTRDEDEPPGARCVAYPTGVLNTAAARIGADAAAFMSQTDVAGRAAWLAAHFGPGYPKDQPDHSVIEDIVSRELNDGFIPMHRCRECGRIALHEGGGWTFCRPERVG